jgi:hypothetical protein
MTARAPYVAVMHGALEEAMDRYTAVQVQDVTDWVAEQ